MVSTPRLLATLVLFKGTRAGRDDRSAQISLGEKALSELNLEDAHGHCARLRPLRLHGCGGAGCRRRYRQLTYGLAQAFAGLMMAKSESKAAQGPQDRIKEASSELQQAIMEVGALVRLGRIRGPEWDEANRHQDRALAAFREELARLNRGLNAILKPSQLLRAARR